MTHSPQGKHPSYFEAILQLREVLPEVIAFTEKEIAKTKLSIAKIVKVKHVKNGLDYYLSDNNLTKHLGKKISEHFGGEYKVTATLHTKKKDKELYRLTVLFRQAQFKKGDEVEYKGETYKVKGINKDIFLQNIKTGKKVHVKWKEMKRITKKNP